MSIKASTSRFFSSVFPCLNYSVIGQPENRSYFFLSEKGFPPERGAYVGQDQGYMGRMHFPNWGQGLSQEPQGEKSPKNLLGRPEPSVHKHPGGEI